MRALRLWRSLAILVSTAIASVLAAGCGGEGGGKGIGSAAGGTAVTTATATLSTTPPATITTTTTRPPYTYTTPTTDTRPYTYTTPTTSTAPPYTVPPYTSTRTTPYTYTTPPYTRTTPTPRTRPLTPFQLRQVLIANRLMDEGIRKINSGVPACVRRIRAGTTTSACLRSLSKLVERRYDAAFRRLSYVRGATRGKPGVVGQCSKRINKLMLGGGDVLVSTKRLLRGIPSGSIDRATALQIYSRMRLKQRRYNAIRRDTMSFCLTGR